MHSEAEKSWGAIHVRRRFGTMTSLPLLPPPPSLKLKQSVMLCSFNLSLQTAHVFGKRLLLDEQTLPMLARIHSTPIWGPRLGLQCIRSRNLPAARSAGASLPSDSSKSSEATEIFHQQQVHNSHRNWVRFEFVIIKNVGVLSPLIYTMGSSENIFLTRFTVGRNDLSTYRIIFN